MMREIRKKLVRLHLISSVIIIVILQGAGGLALLVKNAKFSQTILNSVSVCRDVKRRTNLYVGRMECCM